MERPVSPAQLPSMHAAAIDAAVIAAAAAIENAFFMEFLLSLIVFPESWIGGLRVPALASS